LHRSILVSGSAGRTGLGDAVVGIVWNKASRLKAIERIRGELDVPDDDDPEITGVVFVATRAGSRRRQVAFTAISVAALCLGGALLAILPGGFLPGVLLVVACSSAYAVDAHAGLVVVFANQTGITMARVSPWRFRLKATVVDDRPPTGRVDLVFPRSVLSRGKFAYRCSDRPDLYFRSAIRDEASIGWLTRRFGRPAETVGSPAGESQPSRSLRTRAALMPVGILLLVFLSEVLTGAVRTYPCAEWRHEWRLAYDELRRETLDEGMAWFLAERWADEHAGNRPEGCEPD